MTTSQPRDPAPDALPEPEEPAATAFLPAAPRHRWGFGAFLLVEVVLLSSAAFVSVLVGDTGPGPLPIRVVLLGTMLPTMIAAAVAVLITYVRGNGPVIDLRLEWRWADVKTGFRYGCVGLVFTTLGAYLWTQLVGDANATSAISALVEDRKMSVSAAVVMFVYLWLLGPICEEIIYRGLLWGAAEQLQWRSERWAARPPSCCRRRCSRPATWSRCGRRCCWSSRSRSAWPGWSPDGCPAASSRTR